MHSPQVRPWAVCFLPEQVWLTCHKCAAICWIIRVLKSTTPRLNRAKTSHGSSPVPVTVDISAKTYRWRSAMFGASWIGLSPPHVPCASPSLATAMSFQRAVIQMPGSWAVAMSSAHGSLRKQVTVMCRPIDASLVMGLWFRSNTNARPAVFPVTAIRSSVALASSVG